MAKIVWRTTAKQKLILLALLVSIITLFASVVTECSVLIIASIVGVKKSIDTLDKQQKYNRL